MNIHTKTQIKVGVFVTLGIIVIIASIFMLGGDKAFFKNFIRVHAHFDQVQGLAEGSIVSLSGVQVGNIEKINFVGDRNALDVVMKIDKHFAPRIPKDSEVEIRTQGALGDKFVFILPGELSGEEVRDGDVLKVAMASDLLGMLSEKGKDAGRVFDIINEVYKMTRTINDNNRLEKIIGNLSEASSKLNSSASEAKLMMASLNPEVSGKKLQSSLAKLESVMTKLDRGDGTLGALINDPSLHVQLKGMLGTSTKKNHIKSLLRTSIEKEEN